MLLLLFAAAMMPLAPSSALVKQCGLVTDGRGLATATSTSISFPDNSFLKNNGFLMLPDVFRAPDYEWIKTQLPSLRKQMRKEVNSLAFNRMGCRLPAEHHLNTLFYKNDLLNKILSTKTGRSKIWRPESFPLEFRYYQKGAYMDMHLDDCLFDTPQLEFIYTIENDSDSYTQFLTRDGYLESEYCLPNSLIVVEAGSSLHGVTKLTKGSRSIIKGLYTSSNNVTDLYANALKTYNKESSKQKKKAKR